MTANQAGNPSRIVVGVDGSAGSLAALRWAAGESRLRGGSVSVVMAWQAPHIHGAPNLWGVGMDPSLDSEKVLADAAAKEAARIEAELQPSDDVAISWEVVGGHPVQTLVSVSEGADMLVVGARGHGSFAGALLGSVSQALVTHAMCPVVVIPDPERVANAPRHERGTSYGGGVFGQAHQHLQGEHGQGVYEQGHAEQTGQGVFGQGRSEPGEGVFEQGRPRPEDV
jgi:nucleotide-binding universal stress UspA family protein